MLTQRCSQCQKEHLIEETLHNAVGDFFCSAYCLKQSTGHIESSAMTYQVPSRKPLPVAPFLLVLAGIFFLFWIYLIPSELFKQENPDTLTLGESVVTETTAVAEVRPTVAPTVPSTTPSIATPSSPPAVSTATVAASAAPVLVVPTSDSTQVKAFALARQAALLQPSDSARAVTLAHESLGILPTREAYRVLIAHAREKDRPELLKVYLSACLALSNDRQSMERCYIEKNQPEPSPSVDPLFAPIPAPNIEPAQVNSGQLSPPALN